MALKKRVVREVKHVLITDQIANLTIAVNMILADGWERKETQFISYDSYNGLFQIFYLFERIVGDTDGE